MNALYDKGREAFLSGSISWSNDDIKLALVNTSNYTVNLSSDQYLSSVGRAVVATSSNLSGKTVTAGVADANDVTLQSVTGLDVGAAVIYKDTGDASTSPLIAYLDVIDGLPMTPTGEDVIITWGNGSSRIFKL